MRNIYSIHSEKIASFKTNLFFWANSWKNFCILNSNGYANDTYSKYEFIGAFGCKVAVKDPDSPFLDVAKVQETHKDWLFGFWGYDLKNYTEHLKSNNTDYIASPECFFFIPEIIIFIEGNNIAVHSEFSDNIAQNIITAIQEYDYKEGPIRIDTIHATIDKSNYINTVNSIKSNIQAGDIYEMNFCQEFHANVFELDSSSLYQRLNAISPSPFSSFARFDNIDVVCASPERYIQHNEGVIISQPIKGTIKRGATDSEDAVQRANLYANEKERSENVMIVDLVRNDLSITAEKASVVVSELFGIYEFPQVYQMISTITSKLKEGIHPIEAIAHSFPMGSMTGAPKIRAMELIEQYESFKRGLYSGSIGYIEPDGNYDFNVVIRSIIYNRDLKRLSFAAGGAITINSDADSEYEESMLKANAIFDVLK